MQSFIIDHVLTLKQSLKDSTREKFPSGISSEVKRSKEVNDILRQQKENLLKEKLKKNKRENEKENTIIHLLIKNQEYLNKSACNTASDETFKTVAKGPLKQGNNTETNTIIIFLKE